MPFLSDIANLAQGLNPLITGAFNSASQSRATNNLVAGGQQGIQTIQTGAQGAQNTLAQNLQAQKTALQPFVAPGAAAATTLSNMTPYAPQTFNWTPADIANDPAYQFRLQQGQAAIDAAGNAGGTRFSGATLKDLSQFNTGEAAQAEQADYQRQLGTFQTNEGNRAEAYKTNLGAEQNLEAQGLNAQGQVTSTANTTANSTANIQTSSAAAIAELQTQIANAQAAGNIAQAAQLQNTLTSLLNGAPAAAKSLNNLINPQNTIDPTTGLQVNGTTTGGSPTVTDPNTGLQVPAPASQVNAPQTAMTNMTSPTGQQVQVPTDQVQQFQQEGYQSVPGQTSSIASQAIPAAAAAVPAIAGATSGAGATGAALGTVGSITQAAPAGAVIGSGIEAGAGEAAAAGAGEVAAQAGVEALPGATAATTGGASGGALSSIGSFLMNNPWTIAVGAGLLAGYAIIKATQVHPTADKWTSTIQTPFGQNLSKVVDGFDSALKSGQLTPQAAQVARDQTAQLIQQYESAENAFAAKGSKEQTVINQSRAEMAKDFGPNWSGILGKMDSEIAALPAQAA